MPRRPTAPSSRRDSLQDRLADVTGDGNRPTYEGEEVHEPSFLTALSGRREDNCVDEERDLYRVDETLYHIPEGIMGRWLDDGGA